MPNISVTINGVTRSVREGVTILEACETAGVEIPTLCYHPDLSLAGNCRMCLVEVEGWRTLAISCVTPVTPNMKIRTHSKKVRHARRTVLKLLLAAHNVNCPECERNKNCELQELAEKHNITINEFQTSPKPVSFEEASPGVMRDNSRCILCTRCVRTCEELQSVAVIKPVGRSKEVRISTFLDRGLNEVPCTQCGQCINRCPTGALFETSEIRQVWEAIEDPEKFVVFQTAPAVRVGIAEALGFPTDRSTGKMVAAIRGLGVDRVLDTDFTADLTIIEEGYELIDRLKRALVDGDPESVLPMTTSCSPGWIKFIEHKYPDLLPNVSSCKSPQQMFGALAKTYLAGKESVDPSKVICVSVMPCTAKKFEKERPEMRDSGFKDVDFVLTTRELASMIQEAGIDFANLRDEKYDKWMGDSTGAAVIFGATGGVMEAALRTAYEVVTGQEIPFNGLNITPVRGMEGIREASVTMPEKMARGYEFLAGATLKVAVAHGLVNADKLMDKVRAGEVDYHFIEIMACPGGCLGGGGQPIPTSPEIRQKRADAIYAEDAALHFRKSHANPEVQLLYAEFLHEPLGHRSHELLHTHYRARD
ncbi:MAG: iron hydrogenase small subunit [Candidatus Fermentibacteraceae bacterium]|nr:iron hydrogenase small subunit [Candidatus Fermentibacteraceae bacterium]MBN2608935.1 iron hydrogenase small subunit [Candidatus Fermentibacteraceae bacterium]